MRNTDVVALGELLIDFIQDGETSQGSPLFEANPGGAPCNVLAMLTELGRRTEFIGKVDQDMFGRRLEETPEGMRIGACELREDGKVPATLVLVHKLDNGDRDFSFYRSPSAGMTLTPEKVDGDRIGRAEIFHFGSLSMTGRPARAAAKKALRTVEKVGALRSFDPNLRPLLQKSLDEAKERISYGLAHCDTLRVSDNEIQWLTGKEDFTGGAKEPKKNYDIRLICASVGRGGSRAYYGNCIVEVPGFIREDIIETADTGDTFCGCILHFILECDLDNPNEARLGETLRFANVAASVITTRKGTLKAMPEVKEIKRIISR